MGEKDVRMKHLENEIDNNSTMTSWSFSAAIFAIEIERKKILALYLKFIQKLRYFADS